MGVPARQHDWVCRCGVPLPIDGDHATCAACGTRYHLANGLLSIAK